MSLEITSEERPAAHETEHLDKAIAAFTKIGQKYDILGKSKEQVIEKYGL